jgi:hypothetical protein
VATGQISRSEFIQIDVDRPPRFILLSEVVFVAVALSALVRGIFSRLPMLDRSAPKLYAGLPKLLIFIMLHSACGLMCKKPLGLRSNDHALPIELGDVLAAQENDFHDTL